MRRWDDWGGLLTLECKVYFSVPIIEVEANLTFFKPFEVPKQISVIKIVGQVSYWMSHEVYILNPFTVFG